MAFYDALTKPEAIKDFYENDELVALTKELTDTLRKNKTIDWQKRDTARAKMRMMIKKLLKKYKYPPEGMEDALETVMTQCELWTDNSDQDRDPYREVKITQLHSGASKSASYEVEDLESMPVGIAAEESPEYGHKHPNA